MLRGMPDDHSLPMSETTPEGAPRRRGRPVGDRGAKQGELLAAAIAVIAEEGYAGASVRKVAQRAGHSGGRVTYYFPNKEAMFTAVTEHLFDQFDAMLASGARSDLKSKMKKWIDWTNADDPDAWLALFQLLALARHEPSCAAIFQRRYSQYRKTFAAMLLEGQSQGTIRNDISADLLANQISAMCDGWMLALPIEPEAYTPSVIEALLDATITLISPPPAADGKTRPRETAA